MHRSFAAVDRHIEEHLELWLGELAELCGVPSVSARHQGIEECAELVARLLRRRGFDVQVLPTGGHPAVLAHAEGVNREKTMLLYNHYDVQPPEPLELWESPPFELQVRDGRAWARGAKDDKGELVARLAAIDALLAVEGRLPCRLTWLVEGEEEVGSPNLAAFVERHADQLACQGAIWEEGGVDAQGRPLVTLGVRGLLYVELQVRSSTRDGHSGQANLVPNAAWRLVWALASLKGPDERIRIAGFHDGLRPLSERQRELIQRAPNPEADLKKTFGLEELLLGRTGAAVVAAYFEPTCNLAGLSAGHQGPGTKTVIPSFASAKLDFRLLPDQDPHDLASKLRRHLDQAGFQDVSFEVLATGWPALVDPEAPLVKLSAQAAEEVYGQPAQLVPMSGGTTPMYLFTRQGVPVVAPGVGRGASNLAHSPNENVRLEDLRDAARHVVRVLARFGEA